MSNPIETLSEDDRDFYLSYFNVVRELLDPNTGRPVNAGAHAQRQEMRARLQYIVRELLDIR